MMAKKRKTKARAGKAKAARKTASKPAKKTTKKTTKKAARTAAKRKTVKRAAAKKPAKRRPRKAKSESLGARLEHAMAAVLDTLSDAERLEHRLTRKGVQDLE